MSLILAWGLWLPLRFMYFYFSYNEREKIPGSMLQPYFSCHFVLAFWIGWKSASIQRSNLLQLLLTIFIVPVLIYSSINLSLGKTFYLLGHWLSVFLSALVLPQY